MISIETPKGNIIQVYNDIKQLPIGRYNELQKYLLLDGGVGSTIEDVGARYSRLHAYLAEKKIDEAKKEAENLYYTHYSILEKLNYRSRAFCCLVYSVQGLVLEDYTEDGIKTTLSILEETDLTQDLLERTLHAAKKKISDDLALFFPRSFPLNGDIEFYALLKKKMELTAELIECDFKDEKKIAERDAITNKIYTSNAPNNYRSNDESNALVELDRNFGFLSSMLESNGALIDDSTTCFGFYSRVEMIYRKAKAS